MDREVQAVESGICLFSCGRISCWVYPPSLSLIGAGVNKHCPVYLDLEVLIQ